MASSVRDSGLAVGVVERLRHYLPSVLAGIPLVWLVVVPLSILAMSAFKPTGFLLDPGFTIEHFVETYRDPALWRLVGRTLLFAGGSAIVALVLGTVLALVIERTDVPGRTALRIGLLLPMGVPPFLLAIGWTMLLSPRSGIANVWLMGLFGASEAPFNIYSMTGMIFVEGLALTPSAFLIIAPALRNFDTTLEEAAHMAGSGVFVTQLRIVLPLLAPALAGTFAFLMIVGMMVFDIPGIIGMPARLPVLATHIYDLAHHGPLGLPEYGPMCAIALLTALALVGLCVAYQRLMAGTERFVTVRGKAFKPLPYRLGRSGPWVSALVVVYLLLAVALPLGALVWTSLLPFMMPPSLDALSKVTLGNHAAFFADPALGRAVVHSLSIAVVAATVVCALSLGISWVVVRTDAVGRRSIDVLSFLPIAMPGVLIGTALIYVYLLVKIVPVYGTIWIIAIAHITVYMSFASRAMNAALAQLHAELEEAARMSGADRLRTINRIVFPLVLPALGAVWLWVLSHSARELSSALMLQGVNNATVPTLLYSYWTQGQPTRTAAVGVWLALFMIVLTLVTEALQRWAARRSE